jgi:pimeloyl-ACP methyl ester carboxylesterase
MVLWGGLRPIASQVVADVIAVAAFGLVAISKPTRNSEALMLIVAALAIAVSGNLTNRWTIIFPMIPLLMLQSLRLVTSRKWISVIIFVLSLLLVLSSAVLSVLFPAVELPPITSSSSSSGRVGQDEFNVGIVDLYLPIDLKFSSPIPNTDGYCPKEQDHATVRILYPTLEPARSIPYLRPQTSEAFCEENMKHSAPPPLRPYSWIIHSWRLIEIQGRHHAQPYKATATTTDDGDGGAAAGGLPLVFFSHGLGGNAEMYAYQTQSLAKNGYVVVVIDHTDGSAPVVARRDGNLLRRNETALEFWMDGRRNEYRMLRKAMVAYRAQELLAVVDSTLNLNDENLEELRAVGLDFRGLLNVNEIHYMGHSFGGATSLHAATLRPPTSVIAHDPVTDWMPPASLSSFFDLNRLRESNLNHTYWTSTKIPSDASTSLHDTTELFVLFSDEWYRNGWAGIDIVKDMHDRKVFGRTGGVSRVAIIDRAHHQEFSDACMITPLWLAREIGLTGPRNPLDTAREIHLETLDFLRSMPTRFSS